MKNKILLIDNEAGVRKPYFWALDSLMKQLGRKISDFNLLEKVSKDRVWEEVERLQPNVIVPLGGEALKLLTGTDQIGKWRGSVVVENGYKIVPTFNHSTLVKGGVTRDGVPVRPIMLWDFKKAFRQADIRELVLKDRARITNPNLEFTIKFLSTIDTPIAVDIETERDYIDCIGIAGSSNTAICIPFYQDFEPIRTQAEDDIIWDQLRLIFQNENILKIFQNGAYDVPWLEERYGCKVNNWTDTYVAMRTVYPEMPANLGFIASVFTDIAYYKDDIKTDRWRYNCDDVLVTFEGWEKLKNEIMYHGVQELFDYQMELYQGMEKIAKRGILIDKEKKTAMLRAANKQLKKWETKANEIVGSEINLASPKQLQEYLYGECKMKPIFKHGTKSPTTDQNALKRLQKKYPKNELLPVLAKQRKLAKLTSTYLNAKLDPDGRVRSMFGLTETGRLTSSTSAFWTGMNLQNLPRNDKAVELDS